MKRIDILKEFLSTRPSLSIKSLEKEAGVYNGAISKPMNGTYSDISENTWDQLTPIMVKYGGDKSLLELKPMVHYIIGDSNHLS